MTYLSDLKKLAQAGAYHYAPDDILRLIAMIEAAKAMRDEYGVFWAARKSAFARSRSAAQIKFDVAIDAAREKP